MSKYPDIDYLFICSQLKALEKNMLSHENFVRMAAAKNDDDVLKILTENGWGDFDPKDLFSLECQIDHQRETLFDIFQRHVPDKTILNVFRLRYDYHNLKALIKGQAVGGATSAMLSGAGSIPTAKLEGILREKSYRELDTVMAEAVIEAVDLLARTEDPQLSDLLLDRAMISQMHRLASDSESEFLIGYLSLYVDLANLRVVTRVVRSGKGIDFLKRALLPYGTVVVDKLISDFTPDSIATLFASKSLLPVAAVAAQAQNGNVSLAALDMACDNALLSYIHDRRYSSFGEAQAISHLIAREAELTSVRTVLAGRRAGLSEDQILERLRMSYV